MRHGVDLLLVKREADGNDGPGRARLAQGTIVETAAVTKPPAAPVEAPAR